jgi:2-C-methyl-D-erythritol 4-phosphate cytidylyltransferase
MSDSNLTSQISNLKSEFYAIIVAGGSGTRMQTAVPKQFLLLNGLPVLMHTINAFYRSPVSPQIIVVLPADAHDYWRGLCIAHDFFVPHQLISGGKTRFYSVQNGLSLIEDGDAVVAIHDAVRPLVSNDIIEQSYLHAAEHGNAIVAVKSRDSVRQANDNGSVCLLRDEIFLVQTPQAFQYQQLKKAYQQPYQELFTDDASVVEKAGFSISLVDGSYTNIKITFPEDIAIAEFLLKQ